MAPELTLNLTLTLTLNLTLTITITITLTLTLTLTPTLTLTRAAHIFGGAACTSTLRSSALSRALSRAEDSAAADEGRRRTVAAAASASSEPVSGCAKLGRPDGVPNCVAVRVRLMPNSRRSRDAASRTWLGLGLWLGRELGRGLELG